MELKLPKRLSLPKSQSRSGRSKASRISGGVKFVLFIGDEGAILIHIKGSAVLSRQFIPDSGQDNLQEFRQTLAKDPAAPLLMVVDNMDQSYVQQTLPPVSSLGVGKLIKRRLARDFSANDIKGAVLLGREKGERKDWNFLIVALERSPQLKLWLDFVQHLPNRLTGIYLVAMEADILISQIERGMKLQAEETDVEWKFFVSHNKVGGFRQVVLRNGKFIFTRLGQPVGESTPEVIAGSIEQEMLSTIEYMKRLSYTPQHKLNIYVIASSGIKLAIDPAQFSVTAIHIMTPYEVAQHLGIEGAAQPTDQFGDVVLAAIIGGSKKHVLALSTPQTKLIDKYYRVILYQRMAAVIATFCIFCAAVVIGRDIYRLSEEAGALETEQTSQQQALDDLRRTIKQSNIDVEKGSDLIDMYHQMQADRLSPLPFVRKLAPVINFPVWVKSIEWSLAQETRPGRMPMGMVTPGADPSMPSSVKAGPQMQATLMLEFPQQASDPKIFKVVSKKVLADFRSLFAGYNVRYTSMPEDITESDRMEITANAPRPEELMPKTLDVQLSIRGSLDPDSLTTPPPTP